MVAAKDIAHQELYSVPGIEKLYPIITKYKLKEITIDFQLKVNVVFRDRGCGAHKKAEVMEEVEFVPGLSKIKELFQRNDLTFISVGPRKSIWFRRMTEYRPSKVFKKPLANK